MSNLFDFSTNNETPMPIFDNAPQVQPQQPPTQKKRGRPRGSTSPKAKRRKINFADELEKKDSQFSDWEMLALAFEAQKNSPHKIIAFCHGRHCLTKFDDSNLQDQELVLTLIEELKKKKVPLGRWKSYCHLSHLKTSLVNLKI